MRAALGLELRWLKDALLPLRLPKWGVGSSVLSVLEVDVEQEVGWFCCSMRGAVWLVSYSLLLLALFLLLL